MSWVDTHFHNGEYLPDHGEYVREAVRAGVGAMILCAGGSEDLQKTRKAAEEYPEIYYAAGLHPHDALKNKDFLHEIEELPADSKKIAVGEVGLDYFYDFTPRDLQLKVFETQLAYALKVNLPAIIHCRDKAESELAYGDACALLKDFASDGGRFVLHCYAGSPEFAEKFGAAGSYFGVGGMVTFGKADNIRDLVKLLPLDRLLTETDSPYLAPKPYRGKPNHSKYIPLIGAKLAEVKQISLEECEAVTTKNACDLFHIRIPEVSI